VRTSNSGPWQDGGYLPWSCQDGQELDLWKGSQAFTIHRPPSSGTVQECELVIDSTRWLTPLLRSESRTAVASPQVHSDGEQRWGNCEQVGDRDPR
jgi:hypothetical protein